MNLIYNYSPFKTTEELFHQFDKINGKSGTLIIVFHMNLNGMGEPYLKIDKEKKDILLDNFEFENEIGDLGL